MNIDVVTYPADGLPDQPLSPLCCYHCGLEISAPGLFTRVSSEGIDEFCCAGCRSAAEFIEGNGLGRFYEIREANGERPPENDIDSLKWYDQDVFHAQWVTQAEDTSLCMLLVRGISCAACVWLIEKALLDMDGVVGAEVNLTDHRLQVAWRQDAVKLSQIVKRLHYLGFAVSPFSLIAKRKVEEHNRKDLLRRIGVAAVFGMQIMVISIALYTGSWYGMESGIREFLEKCGLLLVMPVMLYSAVPFFKGAARGVCSWSPGMDVPVALALLLAFAGSVVSIVSGAGDIYFDSIAMFVLFLLGARYVELSARIRGGQLVDRLESIEPKMANKVTVEAGDRRFVEVPVASLEAGDRVLVRPGERVPVDGTILTGISSFDESLLTGEHSPVLHPPGEQALAGCLNVSAAVEIEMQAGHACILAGIRDLAQQMQQFKPGQDSLTNRIVPWFIVAVISLAIGVAVTGYLSGDADWLTVTIAVLVVTCPCALSLSAPLSHRSGSDACRGVGVYSISEDALDVLNKVDHVVFDKTGSLTRGRFELTESHVPGDQGPGETNRVALTLACHSRHPCSLAIQQAFKGTVVGDAQDVIEVPGAGLWGDVDGKKYCLGSRDHIHQQLGLNIPDGTGATQGSHVYLASASGLLAHYEMQDQIRPGAKQLMDYLRHSGIATSLLTGDSQAAATEVGEFLALDHVIAEQKPADKLDYIERLIESGNTVCMIGDGINDTPALERAHLGIAIGSDVNLTTAHADLVLVNENLFNLAEAHRIAKKTHTVLGQNIAWSILYNLSAVPAAMMGLVPPWLAGIGMSLSSVAVVLNAARLKPGRAAVSKL